MKKAKKPTKAALLRRLVADVTNLKKLGKDYANAVAFREVSRPYHYETKVKVDGKDAVGMVSTLELYAHVQTAKRLGYDTRLEAVNGRIQVVFEKKLPERPGEFYDE